MILALAYAAAALCMSPSVHDGDTIRCGAERIRIADIDAPELPGSPRCEPTRIRELAYSHNPAWCDYQRGEQARAALADFLRTGPVMIRRLGFDHYGRTLALVSVNSRDAGAYLLRAGLARRWN
ncbi:thermonuclease family protein [Novosphingobium sp.]|uniref:thermonuclease family protein n=1 Tax=Novosphingobium sp. TaxID=1874826 RepID=UPI003BAC941A